MARMVGYQNLLHASLVPFEWEKKICQVNMCRDCNLTWTQKVGLGYLDHAKLISARLNMNGQLVGEIFEGHHCTTYHLDIRRLGKEFFYDQVLQNTSSSVICRSFIFARVLVIKLWRSPVVVTFVWWGCLEWRGRRDKTQSEGIQVLSLVLTRQFSKDSVD